jgi:hypothetical protein
VQAEDVDDAGQAEEPHWAQQQPPQPVVTVVGVQKPSEGNLRKEYGEDCQEQKKGSKKVVGKCGSGPGAPP